MSEYFKPNKPSDEYENPYSKPLPNDYWRKAVKKEGQGWISPRHPESQAFKDTLDAMLLLHDRKQKDYGTSESPFANVRASESFGIPAWIGCAIRTNDKFRRLMTATNQWLEDGKVNLSNESLEDAWLDAAVYCVIGYLMTQEWAADQ
jgi:hypothetical protein